MKINEYKKRVKLVLFEELGKKDSQLYIHLLERLDIDPGNVMRLRCRNTKCSRYNGNNGCRRNEIIINAQAKCNCAIN